MTIADLINRRASAKLEKRRNHRLSLRLPMEYSSAESAPYRLAYMVDICEGGLLIDVSEKLEVGQNLRVKFYYLSASGLNSIQAHAEITRIDRLGKLGKEYRCAVKFIDLSSDVLKELRKFLKGLN